MPEQSFIQVRVDNNLKQDANAIFEAMGIDMPTAIRMFLKRTILERSLPFDIMQHPFMNSGAINVPYRK